MVAAREQRIPVVPRAEMLPRIMAHGIIAVAGTHGGDHQSPAGPRAWLIEAMTRSDPRDRGGRLNCVAAGATWVKAEVLVEADERRSVPLLRSRCRPVTNAGRRSTWRPTAVDFGRLRATFLEFLHHRRSTAVAEVASMTTTSVTCYPR